MNLQLENSLQRYEPTNRSYHVGFPIGHGPDAAVLLVLGGSIPKYARNLAARAKKDGSPGMFMLADPTSKLVTSLRKTSDGEWRAYKVDLADKLSSFEEASAVARKRNEQASARRADSNQWMVFCLGLRDGLIVLEVVLH